MRSFDVARADFSDGRIATRQRLVERILDQPQRLKRGIDLTTTSLDGDDLTQHLALAPRSRIFIAVVCAAVRSPPRS